MRDLRFLQKIHNFRFFKKHNLRPKNKKNTVPRSEVLGTPDGRGYVTKLPTCGPVLILSPVLKRWGPPRRQGLCSQYAHLWATADFVPRSEATRWQGLCSQSARLQATADFVPHSGALGT